MERENDHDTTLTRTCLQLDATRSKKKNSRVFCLHVKGTFSRNPYGTEGDEGEGRGEGGREGGGNKGEGVGAMSDEKKRTLYAGEEEGARKGGQHLWWS